MMIEPQGSKIYLFKLLSKTAFLEAEPHMGTYLKVVATDVIKALVSAKTITPQGMVAVVLGYRPIHPLRPNAETS